MRIEAACHEDTRSTRDRELIRLDSASDHFGITAALRRAFAEPPSEPIDRDFEELLLKLN
jgi:hypothetical protein